MTSRLQDYVEDNSSPGGRTTNTKPLKPWPRVLYVCPCFERFRDHRVAIGHLLLKTSDPSRGGEGSLLTAEPPDRQKLLRKLLRIDPNSSNPGRQQLRRGNNGNDQLGKYTRPVTRLRERGTPGSTRQRRDSFDLPAGSEADHQDATRQKRERVRAL